MKRFAIFMACAALIFASGCGKSAGTTTSSAPGGIAAVVNGANITMADLDKASASQLKKVETQVYQIKKGVLDDLVETKLIEDAAKKKGLSAEKFVAEEVDAKVTAPTDKEVEALYESSKDRIGKSLDEVKGQITEYLKQNGKARARADLIAKLRQEGNVTMKFEPPRVEIDTSSAPSMGDKGAKVTLVEFSDYQCPFCKRVRPTIWRLLDEYKGKLRYVFMDFPLSFHRESKKAHEAAHCAGDQGKYFEFNRKIFDNQGAISPDDLKKYARELQLNTKDFDQCLDSDKHAKHIDEEVAAGAAVGVSGTPAYFVNGIMLSGALPYEMFRETIESELKR